jgi:short-subunit dehydrogenase
MMLFLLMRKREQRAARFVPSPRVWEQSAEYRIGNILNPSRRIQMENGKLAVVTGASSGIGLELAKLCAKEGYDLVVAADEQEIQRATESLKRIGSQVKAVEADLATTEGVDQLISAIGGRPVDLLLANAGRGLGKGFLDQDFKLVRRVVDTNVTGTVYLAQKIGREMVKRGSGRILFTGSIAGFMPGTFQAVYNGTKAFIDSFAIALRHELKDSGVTVTCLMPGATDTRFFERADMLDTEVGQAEKDDPADVAKVGFDAMIAGEEQVISGWKNKLQVAAAHVTPAGMLAEQHRKMAEPGSARKSKKAS